MSNEFLISHRAHIQVAGAAGSWRSQGNENLRRATDIGESGRHTSIGTCRQIDSTVQMCAFECFID